MLEESFSPKLNRDQIKSTGEGSGKSGSFFFKTHDNRFMMKTISKSELEIMINILPSYIEHNKRYPDSLISKTFGVFTVKREGMDPVYLVLMENTV